MNWIEIDAVLVSMMRAAKSEEQLYRDAMKKFGWDQSQAEAAIHPLLKRHRDILTAVTVTETPKPKRQRKAATKKLVKKK